MSVFPAPVSVDEYLHTAYDPACDYVDGLTLDRNVGEKDHSKAQLEILFYLHERRHFWNLFVILGQRVRVSSTRFRGCR